MIKKIAVLGAGTMGHGIAEAFAIGEYPVNLYEPSESMRNCVKDTIKTELEHLAIQNLIKTEDIENILRRINLFNELSDAVDDVDYVIEATPEVLDLKQRLFQDLDHLCKPETILASNTSSLPLNKMLLYVSPERKKRTMICHWYSPAHIMPLVELSSFGNLQESVYNEVERLYNKIKKQIVKVKKDVPGLVANRIQQGVAREVFSLIEQGIASPEDIDRALKFGPAFRYATTGQLEVADMGGLDIWTTVGDNLLSVMDNRQEANPILKELVKKGKLGIKTGEGFFTYSDKELEAQKKKFNNKLIIQLKASQNYID
ncbi:3-hydroxyacyl-CoA dehydrogenase NAD-binding domain-containing protein [Anaerovorax odorimutans]|uniref:3-hydroxyacyl-CoA dehydrogenase NAD-binding domain-containing protein n=1 Tax=Anaerovorax odorimutans TaxID=109327 RepID=A0ABT1RKT7_9FIRM|nr:3-hydroxyacyl-CoA dehydrogenase NAD-binding domain-containing protein [Anaerovorax odorimutans]MCQ4635793.1 3-hydroxyacyl-CoA dehydrogenase NAD-binding domain-containing protein [Anaerovorax odorimutans]